MIRWLPIDTFPEDGEDCLAIDDRVAGGFCQVVFFNPDTGRLHVPDAQISYAKAFFTHWRELPLTPSELSQTQEQRDIVRPK